jgi:hypothetical protein
MKGKIMVEALIGIKEDNTIIAMIDDSIIEKQYTYHKNFETKELANKFAEKIYKQGGIPYEELHSDKWIERKVAQIKSYHTNKIEPYFQYILKYNN